MKGIIVYDKESLLKNEFFAKRLKAKLEEYNAYTRIVTTDEIGLIGEIDFAVMRVYNETITICLENKGVRVFNCGKVAKICNDKWKTYEFLRDKGIKMAPTQKAEACDLPFPRILKARHGHGGSEVFWTNGMEEYADALKKTSDAMIAQSPVGFRGRDLRVYVIGGKLILAMLRKSDNDFRSNFSLGGSAQRYELNVDEILLVKKISAMFNADFIGIDFIPSNDGFIFNEAEDVVGCRMVYKYTDIDIIKIYAEHIVSTLNNF